MNTRMPEGVVVHQWVHDLVGMSTLGLYPRKKAKKWRAHWYRRIEAKLAQFERSKSIGLITFKDIEEEAAAEIRRLGFKDVASLHYGALRSSNELEDVDVLILLGCPMQNPDDFIAEAQAFFYDEATLDTTFDRKVPDKLVMSDGTDVAVRRPGYIDPRLDSYFKQKSQCELYQAVHRGRPLRVKPGSRLDIFIFTNMRIPDVRVDHLLLNEYQERGNRAVDIVMERLAESGEITVPQLAAILTQDGQDVRSTEAWIRRNSGQIAERTGSDYEGGERRRRGRFATRTY